MNGPPSSPHKEWQQSYFLDELIENAIDVLLMYEPREGYYVCDSGGKDSAVVYSLVEMSGVRYDAHFHRSGIDPPEVIQFLKEHHSNVSIDKPETNIFEMIIEQGTPPRRNMRYCCRLIKEGQGYGRVVLTGTRRSESWARRNRKMVSACPSKGKIIINPILEWSEVEVWDFIHRYNLPYCSIYDLGFPRVGCPMCPCAYWRTRIEEAKQWPRVYQAFLRCFDKMLAERERKGKETTWKSGQEVMDWWLEGHTVE